MILGFKQQINGKPTYFVEKIWASLTDSGQEIPELFEDYGKLAFDYGFNSAVFDEIKPKHHTIRVGNRWKAGMDIHFAINTRTPKYFQFAPIVKCTGVQNIEITSEIRLIEIDGKVLGFSETVKLAKNDGFDSIADFFAYFDKDFTGQIIHWANLKY